MNTICWFSGGVTSAVATKLALEKYPRCIILFCETNQHHPDMNRFIADCEKWYGQKIMILNNRKWGSVKKVLEHGYINSPGGAFCTKLLKKDVRIAIEKWIEFDRQVFGFEHEKRQIKRGINFVGEYPDAKAVFPLIEEGLTKKDCMERLVTAGIELPMMYRLGYSNNNCVGCVKGGMGYWNKIRVDFPEIFEQTAKIERDAGHTCINGVFLDELDPERGRFESIELPECGIYCEVEGVDAK